jgi:glycosyltransferase involved in cell wall biosynthesis
MENSPLLSVLMTCYNRQNFIGEAIESVLASTYQNFELIIVDDCSKDETVSIAKNYADKDSRIKVYVNEKNLGQFKNRNKAAFLSSGEYLKYVDSDDLIYPHTLEVMVDSMLKFPAAGMGFCHTIGESDQPFPYLIEPEEAYKKHYFDKGLLYTGPIGLIIKREVFEKLNGFEEFGMPSDNHFSLKLAAKYPVVSMPRDLFWWRHHDEGRAFDDSTSLANIFDHYNFNADVLNRADCPLSPEQKNSAIQSGKKNFCRGILRSFFSSPSDRILLKKLLKQNKIGPGFLLKNSF